MTIYLTLPQVLDLHRRTLEQSGVRRARLSPQPRRAHGFDRLLRPTLDGKDLCPSVIEKAAALGFSLTTNHPFNDGNKRVGHAALETMLTLNSFELEARIEAERIMLGVAAGTIDRDEFTHSVRAVTAKIDT